MKKFIYYTTIPIVFGILIPFILWMSFQLFNFICGYPANNINGGNSVIIFNMTFILFTSFLYLIGIRLYRYWYCSLWR